MGVKWSTKKNQFSKMELSVKDLSGNKVHIGPMGGQAWLAGIHEYGCNITVTDAMRGFLGSQGLHLKKSTTQIRIPERSFLRNGHDECVNEVMEQISRATEQVTAGNMSADQLVTFAGRTFAEEIKEYIVKLSSPPLHPFTVARKGSSNPLVSAGGGGGIVSSINWKKA
jgi:hypothetical protein